MLHLILHLCSLLLPEQLNVPLLFQMSSSLLEMLDDPDEPTRELALSLLVEVLEKQVSVSKVP